MIRGPISLVIVGAVMIVGTGIVTLGPRAFEGYLPAPALAALEGGEVSSTASRVDGDTPTDFLVDGLDGMQANGPIAAAAGNVPVFIKDVITGYPDRIGSEVPSEIITIRPISGCRLTPPLEGTVVGHALAGETGLTLPMVTYDDTNLAGAVQSLVDRYRETGATEVTYPSGLAYDAYDVAVTETRAPVYLVLENTTRNRIWNIHVVPGVQIERVVLLGGVHSGVANLDPVVPVEVLPGAAMAACGIEPAYPLNPGHRFFEAMKNGSDSGKAVAEAKQVALRDRIAAYNTWFRDSFGVHSDATRAGFDGSTLSVVGPRPDEAETKAVYAPIQGSRIRMTQDIYFEIDGQVAKGEDFAGRVMAIATAFAFGDITKLRQGVNF